MDQLSRQQIFLVQLDLGSVPNRPAAVTIGSAMSATNQEDL